MAAVVNIYIETNITGIKPADGSVITVLEFVAGNGKRATKTVQEEVMQVTGKQAVLEAVNAALERLNRPCEITLYVNNPYIYETIQKKRAEQWRKNHWKNSKAVEPAYRQQWERYLGLAATHHIYVASVRHSYYELMRAQIMKEH